jgi:23S rRNA (cytidine1920-2'-O)/16S rRNA (cytidine1409-2'-O)-methyltransferase
MTSRFVTRAGEKLAAALDHWKIQVSGLVGADFGSHEGGFVDCLLQRGAARVHSVDTAYGILAWKLRKDSRVIVHERTNAMHVQLPEKVDLVTIDVGWTRQDKIIPAAFAALSIDGSVVLSLIKPHYEVSHSSTQDGVLPVDRVPFVVEEVLTNLAKLGWRAVDTFASPIPGRRGNQEVWSLFRPSPRSAIAS